MSQHQDQAELNTLSEELASLLAERKENLNGNMAFSFGYDPSVAAIEQRINLVQARINILLDRQSLQVGDSKELRKVVIYEEECDEYSFYEVGTVRSMDCTPEVRQMVKVVYSERETTDYEPQAPYLY